MIPHPYVITDTVKRIRMSLDHEHRDPRDPDIDPNYSQRVRQSVREGRLKDLHQTWQERYLSAFDLLVKMWHRFDPQLYLYLDEAPRLRAVEILRKAGWLR